ncbi:MAG: DUF3179 domain-containing protein [Chloroflexi bacterium]|nr:DUF3179 domain-containing protein [Chloroflexota bacterium]
MYDAELDGEVQRIGTSGFLYQSNKLMYDSGTRTLWHSLTGEPVIGELAFSGKRFTQLPLTLTTWGDWLEKNPETTVLSLDTGYDRTYRNLNKRGSAYYDYFNSPEWMFPTFQTNEALDLKDRVLALNFGDSPKAYSLEALQETPVVNDTLGGQEVGVVFNPLAEAARPYDRDGHTFTPTQDPDVILDESGVEWRVEEDTLIQSDGTETLARLPGHVSYWFGWFAFHPETELFGEISSGG